MKVKTCVVLCAFALVGAGLANAAIQDDFNRPNSTIMGPNWKEEVGDFRIESNRGRAQPGGGNQKMLWVGTPNPYEYFDTVASIDIFADAQTSHYVALRTGISATNELYIKVQSQGAAGLFTHIGFYKGFNGGGWPGGKGFVTIPTPDRFKEARITTYFKAGDKDTIYLDIDTNFTPPPEYTYSSPGVLSIAGQLAKGVGIGAWNNAEFDNYNVVPEPATLSLLALTGLALLRRR